MIISAMTDFTKASLDAGANGIFLATQHFNDRLTNEERLELAFKPMKSLIKKAIKKNKLDAIRRQIKGFPTGPGLYFMKGPKDKVLYIGKAKNLRSRVSSYFQSGGDLASSRGPKIAEMISKVEAVDFLETPNEVDAMLQEARLIKDIHPPYNTDLVDDKTFPYLEITISDDFPGVYLTRKPQRTGSRLFGPFTSAKDLRAVLVVLQKIQEDRGFPRLSVYLL